MIDYDLMRAEVARHPHKLLFATVSGAHLYGFPSPDSDYDLRGAHILPLDDVAGLLPKQHTVEVEGLRGTVEMDLVTHDVEKFFAMLLKRNGYVLEQLYSPLVITTSPEHEELKEIARFCITRHHSHHYKGFAATQWNLFLKEDPPRVKPLLYVYRVLLAGIHLMHSGVVEANLVTLNEEFHLPYISELVARKTGGAERSNLVQSEVEFHRAEYARLLALLEAAAAGTQLPETPGGRQALHDLLVRIRLATAHTETVTLFRPVGEAELELIRQTGWRAFPARLPEQPIFYPVLNLSYARQIARDWNTRDGGTGYVLRFQVSAKFLRCYEVQIAGNRMHREYWIPADELPEFNRHIEGCIEVVEQHVGA
ncbi:MAG: nucleotidyltransferase domain-containing protein [Acidobacteria bacterium]|nr:nucleotidyltransferase domain-containing protein [Acidobacteriota bacterium]